MQEQFGDVEVLWGSEPTSERTPNGEVMVNGFQRINVIEALLKLSLEPASIQQLDARLAACECIKAFFANHSGIRQHVLRRAIDGHLSGQDEIPNILSVLLTPPESRGNADLYQTWMASVLMFHLIFEDPEAKSIAMKVTEGDAESGEEVITCVQTIVGHLITGMQRGDDERISVGYLMLLCGWLFEDPDVVNDFLGEGSSIQTLLQETKLRGVSNVLVPGLSTILLGIIYEFSSKDSPIPRETLHKLLMEQMGREPYIDKITRFRESPLVRDFEVLPQTVGATQHDGGLPDIFFDRTFIDFLKDNFSRMLRAIDREPGLEISVISNGVQRGISREMVDSLRSELEDRSQAVQKLEADLLSLKRKLEQEQSELMRAMDSSSVETSRIKQINEALQRNHEQELRRLEEQHNQAKNGLLKQHGDQLRALDSQLKEISADREKRGQQYEAEIAELQETINLLESDITRSKEQQTTESARLQKIIQSLESGLSQSREQQASEVDRLQKTIQSLGADLSQAREQASEVANLQKTIQSLEYDLVSAQEQHAGENANLRGTIEKLESDAGQFREQHAIGLANKDKAIQDLQSDMEALKKQHEKEVADQKVMIETLQTDLDKAKDKFTNDTKAIHDEYSGKLSALEKRAEEAERKAEEAEANAKKQAEEASLKSESADADGKKTAKELKDLRAELDKAKSQLKQAEQKGGSANADAKKTAKELENLRKELDKAKSQIMEAEQKGSSDAKKAAKELQDLQTEFDKARVQIKQAEQKGATTNASAEKNAQELESLRSELDTAKSQLKEAEQMGEDADADAKKNVQELKDLRIQLEKANSQIKEAKEASNSSQSELDKAKSEAMEKEDARKAAQSELEDLLIVFGDLEAKREQDKVGFPFTCYVYYSSLAYDFFRNVLRISGRRCLRLRMTTKMTKRRAMMNKCIDQMNDCTLKMLLSWALEDRDRCQIRVQKMQVDTPASDCRNTTYKYSASCNRPLKPIYLSYYKPRQSLSSQLYTTHYIDITQTIYHFLSPTPKTNNLLTIVKFFIPYS